MKKKKAEFLIKKSTNKNYKWSIRKLSTGVASIVVGVSVFMSGGTITSFATELTPPVTEAAATTDAPDPTGDEIDPPADSENAGVSTDTTTEDNILPGETTEDPKVTTVPDTTSAESTKPEMMKIMAADDITFSFTGSEKTISVNTSEPVASMVATIDGTAVETVGGNGTDNFVYSRPATGGVLKVTATAEDESKKSVDFVIEPIVLVPSVSIEASDISKVTFKVYNPAEVTVLINNVEKEVTLVETDTDQEIRTYTIDRPAGGGLMTIKATSPDGSTIVKQYTIEPIIMDGTLNSSKPSQELLDKVKENPYEVEGITPEDNDSVVRNSGTEFVSISPDGMSINLQSRNYFTAPRIWYDDANKPLSGHYVLSFNDPDFYNQIARIEVRGQALTPNTDGSLWDIHITNALFGTMNSYGPGQVSDIKIYLKNNYNNSATANKPVGFSSALITGSSVIGGDQMTTGGKLPENYIFAQTVDTSWFSSNMSNKEATDNGFKNEMTGINDDGLNRVPTLKAVPVYTNDVLTSIKIIYNYTKHFNLDNIRTATNTYEHVPYAAQQIPKELVPFIDADHIYVYGSDSFGNNTNANGALIITTLDENGVVNTGESQVAGIRNGNTDYGQIRSNIERLLFTGAAEQNTSYTMQYNLVKGGMVNSEFAAALAEAIKANGNDASGMLTFESWLGRDIPQNVPDGTETYLGNQPGVYRGSYANAYLTFDDLVFTSTKDVSPGINYNNEIISNTEDHVLIAELMDPNGFTSDEVTGVKEVKNFALGIKPEGLSNITIDPATGNITIPAGTTPGSYVIPVVATYSDGTVETVFASVTITADVTGDNGVEITNGNQEVTEYQPIDTITITPENPDATVIVTGLPAGVVHNPDNTITGNPVITDWGKEEETRTVPVTVNVIDPDGTIVKETVTIIVNRDTDKDGTPDTTDTDDDGDGFSDADEIKAGSDPKDKNSIPAAVIVPNAVKVTGAPQTKLEHEAIDPIVISPSDKDATIDVTNLPAGLEYADGEITGTPVIDWGKTEETRVVSPVVTVTNSDGSVVTKELPITILRDTDEDGIPDLYDPDDDGDGFTDAEEIEAGTDPKDAKDHPEVVEVGTDVTVNPSSQQVTEYNPITNVTIETEDPDATVSTSELLPGYEFDEDTNVLSGTPEVTDWGKTEEFRVQTTTVTVTNSDGSTVEKQIVVVVLRDTDKDGIPDIYDNDDDGDGFTDAEEIEAGTDPKDPDSKPETTEVDYTVTITNAFQKITDNTPITPVVIMPSDPNAKVIFNNIPEGYSYDPETKTLTGTPDIEDWGKTEERRDHKMVVTVINSNGDIVERTITIAVMRDTDGDGVWDFDDKDDDGDGFTDAEEIDAGTDPKDPNSKPVTTPVDYSVTITNAFQKITDNTPILPVVIKPADPNAEVIFGTVLPGYSYDPVTKTLTGTPDITDWGKDEERRDHVMTVTVKNSDGSVENRTITIAVMRDTDNDGIWDFDDKDDDNDGYSDVVEKEKGSDPKDANSVPATEIVDNAVSVTNAQQNVLDKNAIKPIVIKANDPKAKVTIPNLLPGYSYDAATGTITGTPDIKDWGKAEEFRIHNMIVRVENSDGSVVIKEIAVTVLRDTDGDGIPDTVDTDDDNDGYTDAEEITAGTDPKDKDSKPTTPVLSDADKYTPIAQPIYYNKDQKSFPEDAYKGIKNLENLPKGTKVEFKYSIITNNAGEYDTLVVVTYPDGSSEELTVRIIVRGTNTPPVTKPGTTTPETTKPETTKPGTTTPGTETPGTDTPAPSKPGTPAPSGNAQAPGSTGKAGLPATGTDVAAAPIVLGALTTLVGAILGRKKK